MVTVVRQRLGGRIHNDTIASLCFMLTGLVSKALFNLVTEGISIGADSNQFLALKVTQLFEGCHTVSEAIAGNFPKANLHQAGADTAPAKQERRVHKIGIRDGCSWEAEKPGWEASRRCGAGTASAYSYRLFRSPWGRCRSDCSRRFRRFHPDHRSPFCHPRTDTEGAYCHRTHCPPANRNWRNDWKRMTPSSVAS